MTTIYLVRHGETDENSKNIIQGRKNTHLNTKGVQKTKELRQTIISLGVDICYTSPLLRTLETAFGLVADKALIIKDDRLLERIWVYLMIKILRNIILKNIGTII